MVYTGRPMFSLINYQLPTVYCRLPTAGCFWNANWVTSAMRNARQKIRKVTATRKGRTILLSILVVLLAVIGGGLWYWNTHKEGIIRAKLEKAITEKSQGLYAVRYADLSLDEVNGNLSVTGLSIDYDTVKYQALVQNQDIPPLLLRISVPEIKISGVKTPRALIEKEIVGKKLLINNPVLHIYYTYRGKDSIQNIPREEVYRQLLGNLSLIKIDSVQIINAQVKTHDLRNGKEKLHFQDVSALLADVAIDSASNADTTRLFFAKHFQFNCGGFSWKDNDRPYRFAVENVAFNSSDKNVSIKQFQMIPLLDEDAFVKAMRTQDDRFDFTLKDIRIRQVDYKQLLEEQILADTLLITASTFKIYRDLAIPRDKKNRVGTYPHQLLQKIPIDIDFRRVVLNSAFVEYKERNHLTRKAGRVQFWNTYAAISNVTNRKASLQKNNVIRADVNSSFINQTPMKTTWLFYGGSDRFDVKGTVGGIDGDVLNPLTEAMGPARIEKGTVQRIEFDLAGTNYGMKGKVLFLYDDMRVAILEKDEGATEWDKKALTSLAANFLLKNDNPSSKNKEPRVQEVDYTRDTNRSIFHMTWKSLFSGLKLTMGIKK
jgi:hypothetical protein